MPITFNRPRRGWAAVRWQTGDYDKIAAQLQALAPVPGVRLFEQEDGGLMEVPQSAFALEAWHELARRHMKTTRVFEPTFYPPVQPLYPHQAAAAMWLSGKSGGLLADPMGLGKTRSAIAAAETIAQAEGPHRARLIIAPGYTRDVWLRELLACGAIESEDDFCAVFTRNPQDESFQPKRARWWFIHYDVVHAWSPTLVTNPRGRPVVAILDEAHWIKNGRAQRSKGAAAAAGVASARILLTGTPLANRPSELWHLLTVLDGPRSWGSPIDFRKRYCGAVHEGFGHVDTGPTHTEELQQRMSRRYLRREIDEVGIDLPPLTRQVLSVELTEADLFTQQQIVGDSYGMARLLQALRTGSFGPDTLKQMTALRKLTSAAKLRTTVEHVASLIEQGESAVVFAWERKTVERLRKTLLRHVPDETPTYLVHGGYDQTLRDGSVAAFQQNGGVLFSTIDALKEGVTLHRARAVIMHDQSWVPSDTLQAEARIHRIGQTHPCVSTWVMCRDSFDTILASVLVEKGEVIAESLGFRAPKQAADELGLSDYTGPSVEDEAARLLSLWRTP
jgi:hypothetical protein